MLSTNDIYVFKNLGTFTQMIEWINENHERIAQECTKHRKITAHPSAILMKSLTVTRGISRWDGEMRIFVEGVASHRIAAAISRVLHRIGIRSTIIGQYIADGGIYVCISVTLKDKVFTGLFNSHYIYMFTHGKQHKKFVWYDKSMKTFNISYIGTDDLLD